MLQALQRGRLLEEYQEWTEDFGNGSSSFTVPSSAYKAQLKSHDASGCTQDTPTELAIASKDGDAGNADMLQKRALQFNGDELCTSQVGEDPQEINVHFDYIASVRDVVSGECTSLVLKCQVACQSKMPAAAKHKCTVNPVEQQEETYSKHVVLPMDQSRDEIAQELGLSYTGSAQELEGQFTVVKDMDGIKGVECAEVVDSEARLCAAEERIAFLEEQLGVLRGKCEKLKSQRPIFSVDYFTDDRTDFLFYTGLPSYEVFKALLKYLDPGDGGSNVATGRSSDNMTHLEQLDVENQFFLVLIKLRLGLFTKDLAQRFGLNESVVHRIFCSWTSFMHRRLTALPLWGSRESITRRMPQDFANKFPKVRVTLATAEIGCPSSGTLKGMIGMSPDGLVSFVSALFPGTTSNRDVVRQSGFLDLRFDAGDYVIANQSFYIADLLEPLQVKLSIPLEKAVIPLGMTEVQMLALGKVQKRIEAIRSFHILDRPMESTDLMNQIWKVCCVLTNFQGKRLSE